MATPGKKTIKLGENEQLGLPLSHAVQYGSLLFLSGNVSVEPYTRQPLLGTVEQETEQIIRNIEVILKAAGSSLDCVLKTQIFLTDISYFDAMNQVYSRFFPHNPPARSTFGIQLAGPYKLEIEATAYIPE